MGNCDKWSTPKQIKIERAGEPQGTRRGPLKKGERRKGVKARLDELLSSKKSLERYAEWIIADQRRRLTHPEWYKEIPNSPFKRYDPHYGKWFNEHVKKHTKLLSHALKDKIIHDIWDWWVFKP